MHGNPTWAYLYRKFIPKLAAAGHRVVAVDLVGCGRSDKPAERADYTQARHVDWLSRWLTALDLRDITLFCQDWGGTLGLHLVAAFPERFARVIAANTGMPLGEGEGKFMKMWVGMMREAVEFPMQRMLPGGMTHEITPGEFAAYQAPFPDPSYHAGICQFPMLIAVQPDNPGVAANKDAWAKLASFDKPFLTLFGARDPVTPGVEKVLQAHIPGTAGQPHHVFPEANHFIQGRRPGRAGPAHPGLHPELRRKTLSNLPADLPPDFGAALAKLSELPKMGVEDMKLMILLETAGDPLYHALAAGVEPLEAKALLRQNGREETAHAERLKQAIEILTGQPYEIPSLEENPYAKPTTIGSVSIELLEGLVEAEIGGDTLYQGYADNEENEKVAKLLRQNGREEKRHGKRVKQVIKLLKAAEAAEKDEEE